jgi:hypothetical protein
MSAAIDIWAAESEQGRGMSENFKATLLSAFKPLMRPLVRILVRNGVSYGNRSQDGFRLRQRRHNRNPLLLSRP